MQEYGKNPDIDRVLITGGAGYVGSALVPFLLDKGYRVRVLDLYLYGEHVLDAVKANPRLEQIKGDIRDMQAVTRATKGCDAVIHLACISNDPSFELDPVLGKSINLDSFPGLLQAARNAGVKRFVYASSSSVYGVKESPDVRETDEPAPLTDYSRFKLECERILLDAADPNAMVGAILRPATVCGFAPRLRLDLTVNILTIHALVNNVIRVFGGKQLRPNINIRDMIRAYACFLAAPAASIHARPFNIGYQNHPVARIAELVKQVLADEAVDIRYEPTDDIRSYHINSDRAREELGFEPAYGIEDAVAGIADAYRRDVMHDPMHNPLYYNIRRMQELHLT